MTIKADDWISQVDDAKACGLAGVILSFNTSDRVFVNDDKTAPATLKYYLAGKYHAEGYHVGYFALSSGFSVMVPPGSQRRGAPQLDRLAGTNNTLHLINGLGNALRDPDSKTVVILDYAGHIAPSMGQATAAGMPQEQLSQLEILHAWSLDDDIKNSGNFIILINHQNALNSLIEHDGGYRPVQVDLPDEMTRRCFTTFLTDMGTCDDAGLGRLSRDFSVDEFAHSTNGLRLIDIEELFRQSKARETPIAREHVREKKKQTISQLCRGLLEVAEPSHGFEAVAGSDHAKRYFSAIKPLWLQGYGGLPQAILLSGVPGGGKSFLIKAIAKEFDCPCLVMRGVREMWVGQSERNLDRVLQVVDSLAPCILWTDEIDQTIGGERSSGASGDSGTNERMLGRLLEFFGDSRIRGRVLWIATTNRPDLLDVAIKDRFSIKIPFLHPTCDERAALIPVLAKQVERELAPDVDCAAFAQRPELGILTIRALQEVIVWAGTLADLDKTTAGNQVHGVHMDAAIRDYKSTFDSVEHEMIALISLQMTTFTSLLPWMRLNEAYDQKQAQWPSYLDPIVERTTGQIDTAKLERRILELRRQRAALHA